MKILIIFTLLAFFAIKDEVAADMEFHFIKCNMMNETADVFTYDLKKMEKLNETTFLVSVDAQWSQDYDDSWEARY